MSVWPACHCPRTPQNTVSLGGAAPGRCRRCYEARERRCRQRNERMMEALRQGYSLAEVAERFGLAISSVKNLLTAHETTARRLFRAGLNEQVDSLFARAAPLIGSRPAELRSRARARPLSYGRYAVMHVLHRQGASIGMIGEAMGLDRTTIRHGCGRARDLVVRSAEFSRLVEELERP